MKRFVLLFLAISLALIPCLAQEETATNVDEFVEELNALCPISYDEDWGANSFTMVGDRYALVDIKVPDNLQMVLNMLTEDTDKVRKLWVNQLISFNSHWERLFAMMADADRPVVLNLRPGKAKSSFITLLPSDMRK